MNCWVKCTAALASDVGELAAGLHLIARHPGQRRDRGGQRGLRRARRGARDDLVVAGSAGDGERRWPSGRRSPWRCRTRGQRRGRWCRPGGRNGSAAVWSTTLTVWPSRKCSSAAVDCVHGDLAWAAGRCPDATVKPRSAGSAGDVDADARQFPVPDDLAVAAHQRRPAPPGARRPTSTPRAVRTWDSTAGGIEGCVRAARTIGDPGGSRGHGGVDVPGPGREAGEERLVHRGAHHQGAGDEGDAETRWREAGQHQPRGAIAQAGQGGPQHGRGSLPGRA